MSIMYVATWNGESSTTVPNEIDIFSIRCGLVGLYTAVNAQLSTFCNYKQGNQLWIADRKTDKNIYIARRALASRYN